MGGILKKRTQATSAKVTVQTLLSEDLQVIRGKAKTLRSSPPWRCFQPKGQKMHGRASQGGS